MNITQEFIQLALEYQALRFGEFTLKSGRVTPYFFNFGAFNTGTALAKLGQLYAEKLIQENARFDMLLGLAYKGIPLVTSTAIALFNQHQQTVPYCFNRKEAKPHGEGGILIGAPLQGDVMIVDDLVTAGTAINDAMPIVKQYKAKPAGMIIALDRQEKGMSSNLSACNEIASKYAMPVFSIATLDDVIGHLKNENTDDVMLAKMQAYREQYGAN